MPITCQQKLIVCINIGLLNEADSRIASLVDTDDLLSRSFFLGKIERATFCSWKFDVLTVRNWYIIGYYLGFNSTRQRVLQSTPQEFLPLAWCLTVLRNFIHAIPRSRHLRVSIVSTHLPKRKKQKTAPLETVTFCHLLLNYFCTPFFAGQHKVCQKSFACVSNRTTHTVR